MKSQYAGTCTVNPEHTWVVGQEIHYQKSPKVICSDLACYTSQGGKPFVPKTTQTTISKPRVDIETVHAEADTILSKYGGMSDAKFESICKYFISRMMSR